MYILKNACKNLTRNKGRNILLGVIMIAILSCAAISVIINTASNEIINGYKDKFGSEVFIQSNQEKMQEKMNNGDMGSFDEGPSNELKEKLAKSEHLKETIFSSSFIGYSDKIKALDQDEVEKRNKEYGNSGGMNVNVIGGNKKSENAKDGYLNILGGLNKAGREEFNNGTRKITDGKMPEKDGEAMISEDFAKLNNLKVGDSFKSQNPDDPDNFESLQLTVSGIYYDGSKSDSMGFKHPIINRKNEIITTYDTLRKYNEKVKKDKDLINLDAQYYLKNPDLLDAFNEEAHKKGLSDTLEISTDATSYNNIVKPIEGLKKVSNIFMFLVLGFGGSILILISILGIRERKYEIGVLRAMGMKKGKVALGLIFETLFMIGISLTVGLGIGSLSAQPISNILLQGQLDAQKEASSGMMSVAMGATSSAPPIEKLDVFLSGEAVLGITLIALLLGAVSIGIGILYIMRFEPRKILSERN
ncbi:cell division protein FtsX [Clostridium sulfidigenes]|uniref:Cell division protein FtsX n=1 Tax=Clostridium sulfidigenes TaxID=318464 RepID=A0A084J7N9_9CLOT|nr:ABC transporter permease [Clostridium sulfidigenes]KEZ84973.1 cell division protein FtsX [Clostridium sulfidigenes]HAR85510.1 ABC transporter permease [Clostridium sp.]